MERALERRKHKRLETEDGAFVFFSSQPSMAGKMIDISRGGLGFTYLASRCHTTEWVNLTLICIPHSLDSHTIPVRTISDFKMPGEDRHGARRCGVQFKQLTKDQKGEIESFIKCCTVGAA